MSNRNDLDITDLIFRDTKEAVSIGDFMKRVRTIMQENADEIRVRGGDERTVREPTLPVPHSRSVPDL